jgi:hypothetical protein
MPRYTKKTAPRKLRRGGRTYTLRGSRYVSDGGDTIDMSMMLIYLASENIQVIDASLACEVSDAGAVSGGDSGGDGGD